ncbi:outer membrane beta-barrel protein [Flavobacterium sp.]|uniref:outer membrane protein n=1 Tax=Flavobacterium sp. TaxID=239 RepID=UPI0028BEDCEA|nr:outer membrane beta-barrel protein [Flavobacterium sp.]
MKKIILSVAAVFAFGFANAQEEAKEAGNGGFAKGDLFVSGSVGFNSAKMDEAKGSNFYFKPEAGYFLTENIALGLGLEVGTAKNEGIDTYSDSYKTNNFGAEVFGRYYFTPASQFSMFAQLGVGFGTAKTEAFEGAEEAKVNSFGVNAGLGLNYFVANNWALQANWAGLGYNSSKPDADGAEATNTFGLNVDMSAINFGVLYKF